MSCVAKLLERILADRLYQSAEINNMFSRFQASFLKGQSCEDQITRIIQVSKDGFQQRLMKRSLSTLLDFSKAYDTVWREKLLLHMLNTGVSPTFIHWIQYFLNDRRGLQPEVVTTIKKKEGLLPAPMRRKQLAMKSALSQTSTNANHHSISILFCRDSKPLCEALTSSHPRTFSIHNSINSISSSIFIQWISGHSTIPGNDLVDKAAKETPTIAIDTIFPISLSSSIQVMNDAIRDAPPTHERVASVYQQ